MMWIVKLRHWLTMSKLRKRSSINEAPNWSPPSKNHGRLQTPRETPKTTGDVDRSPLLCHRKRPESHGGMVERVGDSPEKGELWEDMGQFRRIPGPQDVERNRLLGSGTREKRRAPGALGQLCDGQGPHM